MSNYKILPAIMLTIILTFSYISIGNYDETIPELNEHLNYDYKKDSGRSASNLQLSTSSGVPGYPISITFDATGIATKGTWIDYNYWEDYSGNGVFECQGQTWDNGNGMSKNRVIPAVWLNDGITDCSDGSDEQQGSSALDDTTYKVWAVSDTGEEYLIASQKAPTDGMIDLTWNILPYQPTGDYNICVDQTSPAYQWTMEHIGYQWEYNSQEEERLASNLENVGANSQTLTCTGITISLYQIRLDTKNVVLPGSELKIDGVITNPVTGAPVTPSTLQAVITYYTGDEGSNGGLFQTQTKNLVASSRFDFSVIMPSNLYNGSSSLMKKVNVYVWANSSSGDQTQLEMASSYSGSISVYPAKPQPNSNVYIDEPVAIAATAVVSSPGWGYSSLKDHTFTLKITKWANTFTVSNNLKSDESGNVIGLVDLSSYGITGASTLILEWTDPATLLQSFVEWPIYLTTKSEIEMNNVGKGINLNYEIVGDSAIPGESVEVIISAEDDAGNPLANIWIHWSSKIRTESAASAGGNYWEYSKLNVEWTDPDGKLTILFDLPSNYKSKVINLGLEVLGYNESGVTDYLDLDIPGFQPQINIEASLTNVIPGKNITFAISTEGINEGIIYSWEISCCNMESSQGMIQATADEIVNVTIMIPQNYEDNFVDIYVRASSNNFEQIYESERVYTISGTSYSITSDKSEYLSGESLNLNYSIESLNPNDNIQYPIIWSASLIGNEEVSENGEIESEDGSITMQLPQDIAPGIYILSFDTNIGQEEIFVFEVIKKRYSLAIEVSNEDLVAGETIKIPYKINSLSTNETPDFPLHFQIMISGLPNSIVDIEASSIEGEFEFTLPSDLSTGAYLIEANLGDQKTTGILNIISKDDDEGISGAFYSTNDVLSPAAPILTIIALVLSIVSLTMIMIGGRNRNEELGAIEDTLRKNTFSQNNNLTTNSPTSITSNLPPPLTGVSNSKPLASMQGTLSNDGYEWLEHDGKKWYRTAYSEAEWQQYT